MCGIIGYVGKNNATQILIDGLKRLEYRGYDSAGIAIYDDKNKYVRLIKAKGKIKELEDKLPKPIDGNIGIGHTRWATHGEPSERNAHPHSDCTNRVFVCHNGIIENYKELKEALIRRGHKFKSETDTEVLAHIIEENLRCSYGTKNKNKKNYRLENAVAEALGRVRGTYGLTILSADWPDRIIVAKNSSPLIIGAGKGGNIVASDAAAIVGRAKDIIYMKDGEIGVLAADNVKIFDVSKSISSNSPGLQGSDVRKSEKRKILALKNLNISGRKEKLEWNIDSAQKGGYPHFMLKEIFEQPESIFNSFRGRLVKKEGAVKLGGLESVKNKLKRINRIVITGCGTAYLAGLAGKMMIEELAGIPCEAELASELRYRKIFPKSCNLAMVAISQSGETADTLAALREARQKNVLTLGIVNVVGSTIARETDAGVYNHAGPEIGVASTKALTSQLTVLALLALFLGRRRNLSKSIGKKVAEELSQIPRLCHYTLVNNEKKIKALAKKYSVRGASLYGGQRGIPVRENYNNFLYIGRKYNFPTALEGALKLKEISYIHAEGYGAGEMKHGPIAMIDENFPTIAIAPEDSVYDKMVSNMEEIKARRGKIIAITTEGNEKIKHIADDWLYIPKTLEMLTPILAIIPLQLFAYYMGVLRGLDVDKPRNLAKSVTVE